MRRASHEVGVSNPLDVRIGEKDIEAVSVVGYSSSVSLVVSHLCVKVDMTMSEGRTRRMDGLILLVDNFSWSGAYGDNHRNR
jgi:hypothetical protein